VAARDGVRIRSEFHDASVLVAVMTVGVGRQPWTGHGVEEQGGKAFVVQVARVDLSHDVPVQGVVRVLGRDPQRLRGNSIPQADPAQHGAGKTRTASVKGCEGRGLRFCAAVRGAGVSAAAGWRDRLSREGRAD
jgi:hypothetical protein